MVLLFSVAIGVTLIAPRYIDKSWTEPSSEYQVQMHDVVDPHIYVGLEKTGDQEIQMIQHLKKGYTLLGFSESEFIRIIAPKSLEKYITHWEDKTLKLTSQLLLLREPKEYKGFKTKYDKKL